MGYDMWWRKAGPDEAEAVAALSAELRAACDARDALPKSEAGRLNVDVARVTGDFDSHSSYDGRADRYAKAQDAVMAASRAVGKAERSYFRLNISGMGRYRNLMETLGMAFEDDPHPPFPKIEDHETNWEDVEAVEYPEDNAGYEWTDERLRAALKYREAVNAVLAFHGKTDTPGIPLHKFGSNDGWVVLPVECEAAVRTWRDFTAREGDEAALNFAANNLGGGDTGYWLEWIAYLAGAARHDGFEVH
jgi:hypothetical protein